MTSKSQKKGTRRNCPLRQQLGKHISAAMDTCNNRRTVGDGVFCAVHAEAIQRA
jgi:hypothetical protein